MKKIVIVGAGLSGLTAALYLSRAGFEVQLIEQNATCGGLIHTFAHEGFSFDTGARSIENSGIIRPLLADLEIDLELVDSPVSIGIKDQIISISNLSDIKHYLNLLEMLFPNNSIDIKRISKKVFKILHSMDVLYGFDNPVFKENFTQDRHYLFTELLPWFRKFIFAVMRMNKMNEPIESYLAKLTNNRSLSDIIDQHFFKQTPTFFALGYFYVYLDYLYPKGGTGSLPEKLLQKFLELQGEFVTNTKISSVDIQKKTLKDQNNTHYAFDSLIWSADLKSLYTMIDSSSPASLNAHTAKMTKDRILQSRGGDSVFTLYLGVNLPKEDFQNISHGHLFYTPNTIGLGELHRSTLRNLIDNFDSTGKEEIKSWVDEYCRLTTYEISIPVLRDETLAPEGKTGIIISFLFEYDLCEKVSQAGWIEEFKHHIEIEMIDVLQNTIYPDLKKNIIFQESSSPLDIKKIIGSSEGGITGWTYELESPVVNNLKKIPKSIKTPFEDIYQAGQWAYSPAGIPTAILTGWYAADAIIHRK